MSEMDFALLSQQLDEANARADRLEKRLEEALISVDAQLRKAIARVEQVRNDRETVLGQLTDLEHDLSTTRAHLDNAITRAEVAERATNVARDQRDEALEEFGKE